MGGDDASLGMATDISITEILRSACDSLSGPQALAQSLGVTKSDLQAWLEGERNLPFGIAVRVLQLSSAAHTARAATSPSSFGTPRKDSDLLSRSLTD